MSPDNSYASGVVVDRLSSLTEAFQGIMYFSRGFLIPILVVLNCHWFSMPQYNVENGILLYSVRC